MISTFLTSLMSSRVGRIGRGRRILSPDPGGSRSGWRKPRVGPGRRNAWSSAPGWKIMGEFPCEGSDMASLPSAPAPSRGQLSGVVSGRSRSRVVVLACIVSLGLLPSAPCQEAAASRPAPVTASRPSASVLSGGVLWKEPEKAGAPKTGYSAHVGPGYSKGDGKALVVGADGRLGNALVSLVPLQGQDLSRIPPAQVPGPSSGP